MPNAIIRTLTPLHIGSGVEWQGGFEYVYFPNEGCLAILDPLKVLNLIGEENMSHWISCITNGKSVFDLLSSRKASLKPIDVASIIIKSNDTRGKVVKSHIRSEALNVPYLPGSSLKGSIRTAVFAEAVFDNKKLVKKKENLGDGRRRTFKWDSQILQKQLFGRNPNSDVFRILRPGDAHFHTATRCLKVQVVNKLYNRFVIKDELTQYVEVVPSGQVAKARLDVNENLRNKVGPPHYNELIGDTKNLFKLINRHFKRLVEDEIEYWDVTVGNPEVIGDYVDIMHGIKEEITNCVENECVLRIGWGSGFRFMTGDWHGEMKDEDYEELIRSLRPRHPVELVYPKTMRLGPNGVPLGFVKIKLSDL